MLIARSIVLSWIAIICVRVVLTEGRTTVGTAYLKIKLSSENDNITDSLTWKVYTGIDENMANVPSNGITGIVHRPVPNNACKSVQPLPEGIEDTLALVEDYPSCVVDMIANVKKSGYKLIIASSANDTHRDVNDDNLLHSGFPVVIVTQKYAAYLKEHVAIENITDIDIHNVTKATVYVYVSYVGVYSPLAVALIFGIGLFIIMLCIKYGLCNSICGQDSYSRIRSDTRSLEHQARLSRDDLTTSIRRHMAELHIDPRTHAALGEWTTKRLPTRKYQTGKEKNDSCAICVSEFENGDNLRVLPCEHVFHSECVDEWLINHSSLCPLCKRKVPRQNVGKSNLNRGQSERLGLRQQTELGAYGDIYA